MPMPPTPRRPTRAIRRRRPPQPVFDPSTLTKSEIETLQRLAERRDGIEKRERDLDARDGLMKAGESRIDGKVAQLQDLEKNIKGLLQQYDGQKDAEVDQLVRIYSAMKPKEAAGIFETLDMPILVAVVQNMKDAKVAPIMAHDGYGKGHGADRGTDPAQAAGRDRALTPPSPLFAI